jgi:hypothetical protein
VLVAVMEGRVILTKRASHLKHHPGQIAFPGGKQDRLRIYQGLEKVIRWHTEM